MTKIDKTNLGKILFCKLVLCSRYCISELEENGQNSISY